MDSFQQPAFSFSMPTDDFDPDCVPTDGEQYLQKVVFERNKCPAVVVKPFRSNVDEDTLANNRPTNKSVWDQYAADDVEDKTPIQLLPTAEWLQIQSNAFQKLRDRITAFRQHLEPDYDNIDLQDDLTENTWLVYCQKKEPLLQNMLHIHQRDLEKLIEYQSNWLIDDIDWYLIEHWFPQWVYSSLACLRLPCEPNLLNSLRKIAKTCHHLRNKLSAEESTTIDSVTPFSLIICIVSKNFDQIDLGGKIKSQ